MDVAYEGQQAADVSPGVGKAVELVDRFFVLVWVGFYLLLPTSGWAHVMFTGWADQKRDLAALKSVLAVGHADAIAQNGIGPAYIAVAAVIHDLLRLSPEDSLVLLTRGSYVLSVACGVLLVRMIVRNLIDAPPLVSVGAQLGFVGLVFAAGTWHWSDVPWSHFLAAFLAAAVYASRFVPARTTIVSAAVTGAALGLLSLTRSFELAAVVLAWGLVAVALAVLRLHGPRTVRVVHVLAGATAFVATSASVYLLTGKHELFFLYGNSLDQQSGHVSAAEVATTPTFSFGLVPAKLVQLFVEPCYQALCSLSDYAGGALPLPHDLAAGAEAAGNERLWRLPLAIQLPSLVLLPVGALALVVVIGWAVRNREASRRSLRSVRLLLELTVASTGIVLGYAASTLTGSPHLRYGFARDFLLPALLSGIVAVSLVSVGVWLVLSRSGIRRLRPESVFVLLALLGSGLAVFALAYARANGIPRIESRQLGDVVYTARCDGQGACSIAIAATTTSGRGISIPEASTLTFACDGEARSFSVYVARPTAGVRLDRPCPSPRLVAAWPTSMGLPPGTYELDAVRVRNV